MGGSHLVSLASLDLTGTPWTHLVSPGLASSHVGSSGHKSLIQNFGVDSLGLTWYHMNSLGLTWSHLV